MYIHLDLDRKIELNLILGHQFMLWDFLALNAYYRNHHTQSELIYFCNFKSLKNLAFKML